MRNPLAPLLVSLLLASSLAGCVGDGNESEDISVMATYEATNATIVEYWYDGQLVDNEYPLLTFDFASSTGPYAFVSYSVNGEHAAGQADDLHCDVDGARRRRSVSSFAMLWQNVSN